MAGGWKFWRRNDKWSGTNTEGHNLHLDLSKVRMIADSASTVGSDRMNREVWVYESKIGRYLGILDPATIKDLKQKWGRA
jgi:hypothetical protein